MIRRSLCRPVSLPACRLLGCKHKRGTGFVSGWVMQEISVRVTKSAFCGEENLEDPQGWDREILLLDQPVEAGIFLCKRGIGGGEMGEMGCPMVSLEF